MSNDIVIETGDEVSIDQIKQVFYLVIATKVCPCGNRKVTGIAFCNACMLKLSVQQRNRLYLMIRRSFVKAYFEAAAILPKAETKKCACGCGADVPFPYKYAKGHIIRAGKKDSTPSKAARPEAANPQARQEEAITA